MSATPSSKNPAGAGFFLQRAGRAALLILGILFYLLPCPLRNALSRVPLTRFIAVLLI